MLKSKVNLKKLLELKATDATIDDGRVYMHGKNIDRQLLIEPINEIERLICKKVVAWMFNVLKPDTSIPIHTDTLKYQADRYHLVLETNGGCCWWDEDNGYRCMEEGYWYGPMPYFKKHAFHNLGDSIRTHLIVDLV